MPAATRDHLVLFINGRRHEVRGAAAIGPLSDFLRTDCQLTGTKVVCAEGDCGSCTVLVGRVRDGHIVYQPVTSCIQYLPQLDAAHVITVEGLKYDGRLNPAQEAMVAYHGSQCGYCTPGFVASLCSLFDQKQKPTRHEVTRALVGNLCRCTGYGPILDAAANVDAASMRPLSELYPERALVKELNHCATQSVLLDDGHRKFFKPATLAGAVSFKADHPDCTILSGGTDLGVHWNKGRREIDSLLCVGQLAELHELTADKATLVAGGAVTLTDLEHLAHRVLPEFGRMLERFGSPPIKNAGTLGGNIANGSPIGDTMPALFVLNAEIELAGKSGSRRVNINEFYTGYRQNVMRPDELIHRVHVPLPASGDLFRVYKVSKRRDLDISSFTAAVWMQLDGDSIAAARIAYGGVAPVIVRLAKTEAWLSERRFTEATLRQAGRMAHSEIAPISDVRGSADYRNVLAENIMVKFGRDVMAQWATAGGGG